MAPSASAAASHVLLGNSRNHEIVTVTTSVGNDPLITIDRIRCCRRVGERSGMVLRHDRYY